MSLKLLCSQIVRCIGEFVLEVALDFGILYPALFGTILVYLYDEVSICFLRKDLGGRVIW